jgi:hypothetical protein
MSVILDSTVKADVMTAIRDHLADGTLELQSASDTVLAIFTLDNPAGSVTGPVWTVGLVSSSTTGEAAAGGGTAATKARFKDSTGTVKITGLTVALSAADIILDNTSIADGQTVSLTSLTLTHPVDPA